MSASPWRDGSDVWACLHLALNSIPHGLCVYDADDRLAFVNDSFSRLYRQPAPTIPLGTHFLDVLAKSVALGNYNGRTALDIWKERKAFIDRREPGVFLQALGDGRLVAITHQPLENGGWAAVYEDVTERRRQETHLHFMAHHDALTRLPNRLLFDETLRAELCHMAEGASLALLCLDLDGFKTVNDSLGHAAGDALLCQVADRLRSNLRDGDVVARRGGDEFAVLLPNTTHASARSLAAQLQQTLETRYDLGGTQVTEVGASVGLACAPLHASHADALLAAADEDLYRTKRMRRDRRPSSVALGLTA